MRVPVEWLNEYVKVNDIDIKTFEDSMIMSGSNTETVEYVAEGIEKVVIGRIEKIWQHPNADKLVVLTADVGERKLQIVTGAKNINEGDYVPVALPGAKLPGGVTIESGELRGEISNGMLCSAQELGFDTSVVPKAVADGIWILDKEYPLGEDVCETLKLKDNIIEFEITPNRPDCLCMLGMARESAATFERPMEYPEVSIKNQKGDVKDQVTIKVEDPDLCGRFSAKMVSDIKIEPSPLWMQLRLMKAGMRPINNIVDITNYVMIETGQPLHAYDLDTLADKTLIARRAKEGEIIKTLDGSERKMHSDNLMIADGKRTVGIAGIMGGEETEITEATKNILIESAHFSSRSIRDTSKRVGLRTEASARYEKGVDIDGTARAVERACQLIELFNAGTVAGGTIDVYKNKPEQVSIKVRPDRINALIGTKLEAKYMMEALGRLEIKCLSNEEGFIAYPPTNRLDLLVEADIVEEIARVYGYDNIENTLPRDSEWGGKTEGQKAEDKTKDILTSMGLNEVLTYSFVSPKTHDMINLPEDSEERNVMKLMNPLGEEYSIMRRSIVPNMMDVIKRNFNRKKENFRAFELGNTFIPKEIPVTQLPTEKKSLVMAMYGKGNDFFALKGVLVSYLNSMGVQEYEFVPEKEKTLYHPGRTATLLVKGERMGYIGEIHPDVLENYGLDVRVCLAEIDYEILMNSFDTEKFYSPIARYPAISRDIAVKLDKEIYIKQIEDVIKKNGGELLTGLRLFDVYEGKQIEAGKKSVAYALIFQSTERTLKDEEVNLLFGDIVRALEIELKAELRK